MLKKVCWRSFKSESRCGGESNCWIDFGIVIHSAQAAGGVQDSRGGKGFSLSNRERGALSSCFDYRYQMNAVVAMPNSPVTQTAMLLKSHQSSLCWDNASVNLFTFAIAFFLLRCGTLYLLLISLSPMC